MFQKLIFTFLIIGLAFFLYLLKTGEINSSDFNINILRTPVRFEVVKNASFDDLGNRRSDIKLVVRGTDYTVYSFEGTAFTTLTKADYPGYHIPLEAIDAVTGTWLGNRYVFYVIEYKDDKKAEYHVFKSEQSTDATTVPNYQQIKTIQDFKVQDSDALY